MSFKIMELGGRPLNGIRKVCLEQCHLFERITKNNDFFVFFYRFRAWNTQARPLYPPAPWGLQLRGLMRGPLSWLSWLSCYPGCTGYTFPLWVGGWPGWLDWASLGCLAGLAGLAGWLDRLIDRSIDRSMAGTDD